MKRPTDHATVTSVATAGICRLMISNTCTNLQSTDEVIDQRHTFKIQTYDCIQSYPHTSTPLPFVCDSPFHSLPSFTPPPFVFGAPKDRPGQNWQHSLRALRKHLRVSIWASWRRRLGVEQQSPSVKRSLNLHYDDGAVYRSPTIASIQALQSTKKEPLALRVDVDERRLNPKSTLQTISRLWECFGGFTGI